MPEITRHPAEPSTQAPAVGECLAAMAPRFNFFFRWFARRFFRHFHLEAGTVAQIRELESRGAVVYVMRYASRLDYFLFNTLFLREGLRLSRFANGLLFYYYRPLWEAFRITLRRRRGVPREVEQSEAREHVRELCRARSSFFLFLRTARVTSPLGRRRRAARQRKAELDLLEEVVRSVGSGERPVFVVPLALFWRKGPRTERRRFLNLAYGAQTRPSDLAKVASFLTTYRDLSVKVGEPIDLAAFVQARPDEERSRIAQRVRRALLIYFYREEKVVEGPTVRSPQRVMETVLDESTVRAVIEGRAQERRISWGAARLEAEKIFREIAANMNSTFLAVLNLIANAINRRIFASIEVTGLEKVADYAKRHPLVLVPSHRSYFDFLIVSPLFYQNHLVPPHIAARENMGFGPFGYIFRRAGAFFMRQSFDDPLYKEVFRAYVRYLVKEGFTQEFFIEGGRSRTGKTLAPRLGMLSWNVEAFLSTARRDLFFVPIAITYERLVEERAMVDERQGGRKQSESVLGLIRARKYLQRRFGSVFVNFGEPISMADALGGRRERFASGLAEVETEKRAFIESLGNRLVERINWAVVANSTSVAASVLLGESRRGLLRHSFTTRMGEIVEILKLQDVKLTPALVSDQPEFRESISFLLRSDLIRSAEDPRGEILYFEESKRLALDLYRNAILHYLAAPSFLARRLLSETSVKELRDDLASWLDLFFQEFFTPRGEVLAAHFEAFLDHFARLGYLERHEGVLRATKTGEPYFRFLAEQTRGVVEAYYAAFTAVASVEDPVGDKALGKLAAEQFERAQLLGEVERREASNPVTFGNAFDLLVRREILRRLPPETRRGAPRGPRYARGPAYGEFAALRERLAAALPRR